MPIIDDTTPNLGLPLPNGANYLQEDVGRLRSALTALDAAIKAAQDAIAALPTDTEVGSAVAAGVSGVVGSAPVALNTLQKLAAAIGNDENFAANMTTALSGKLPNVMASPTVLGGIKIGSGLVINGSGVVSVPTAEDGVFTFDDEYFTPTAGQTSFAVTGGYVAGQIEVFLNGVLLFADDYTATDGSNVVLAEGAATTDKLLVRKWAQFVSADYCKADGTGATGTWPISITGNAATATNAGYAVSAGGATAAGTALDGFGVGQAWANVGSSRGCGAVYQNTTMKPIMVAVGFYTQAAVSLRAGTSAVLGAMALIDWHDSATIDPEAFCLSGVIPIGAYYTVTIDTGGVSVNPSFWTELR